MSKDNAEDLGSSLSYADFSRADPRLIKKAFEMLDTFMACSKWEWKGSEDATDGWTVLGVGDDGGDVAIEEYDSFLGATSTPFAGHVDPKWIMPREKAEELASRIASMDSTFYPPFMPRLVKVKNGMSA